MTSLSLRPWRPSDADALVAAYSCSPDLEHQLSPAAGTGTGAQRVIREDLGWDRRTACNWAIEEDGAVTGNAGIGRIDHLHQTAWMYYWLALPARGKGLAARAVASLAFWAQEELKLHRLELGHRTNNPASCRVALAAGFAPEGIQRAKLRYGRERFDVETHARLATDPAPDLPLIRLVLP